jgi:hypothetical protein
MTVQNDRLATGNQVSHPVPGEQLDERESVG